MSKNIPLRVIEIIVLGGIVTAFVLPVFGISEEGQEQTENKKNTKVSGVTVNENSQFYGHSL